MNQALIHFEPMFPLVLILPSILQQIELFAKKKLTTSGR